jgi:predicted lipoprotein with Yx(FWY)xxD motif
MVRKLIALTAIVAMSMALVAVAGAKPQVKHVSSKISLNFTNGTTPYTQDEFSGRVKAHKSCRKRRTVTIDGTALTGTTNSSGDYVIAAGDVAPGSYTATVASKNRKTNNGTKIVCDPKTSDPVTVP